LYWYYSCIGIIVVLVLQWYWYHSCIGIIVVLVL